METQDAMQAAFGRFMEAFRAAMKACDTFQRIIKKAPAGESECRRVARKQMHKRNAARACGRSKSRSARGMSRRFNHPQKVFRDIQPRGVIFADGR